MQTLISQCLDPNFLNEIFTEQDEYFVSNIERVDSVTLLRKDKLFIGTSWTIGFQNALTVWPCLDDLGAEACTSTVCGGCEKSKASTMIQLYGQPYHPNTLCAVPPDTDAIMNRNFSVCGLCARLCQLYHKLHHQKYQLFVTCSDIVKSRKDGTPGIDTTNILNELLADDAWLEQQFKVMQDLWADADSFQK
ncbi:proline-rich protein 12 [Eurytemora carolleeae]|uniref:proline-rich protein 12 n=1 Tax=Eurytemora carolleeae TaxID=1294199 RepID=UPI000C78D0C9|nr:proline-rich protein 12 [Eurytemora carolleeae]|eukprot:XP_023326557.1 proline-rich protein 12-like [Eurytemora affinis]